MKVRAVRFDALVSMLARIQLITLRMIFLFLPTMAVWTSIFIRTTIFIVIDMVFRTPVAALILVIQIDLRFSPKILPIVRIDALVSLMICLIIGAPYCFEMEHIKVRIFFKLIDHFNRNFRI